MTFTFNISDDELESIIKKLFETRDLFMLLLLLKYNNKVDQLQLRYIRHKYPIPVYRLTSAHKHMIFHTDCITKWSLCTIPHLIDC